MNSTWRTSVPLQNILAERAYVQDSLMCEYSYALDLDKQVLEYYVGFQKAPQPGNPYGTEAPDPNTTSGLSSRYS